LEEFKAISEKVLDQMFDTEREAIRLANKKRVENMKAKKIETAKRQGMEFPPKPSTDITQPAEAEPRIKKA
jgi:hypothetical protein